MEISGWHLLVMCGTIALVIGGGLWAARGVRSAEGFSLGGRAAGVPLVAGSIAGTCVGGGATVGTAQLAYTTGLSAWWFTIGSGTALILMGIFYARSLRRSSLTTVPEFLALNYGRSAGTIASVVSSLGILFSAVASTIPGIKLIAAIFTVPDGVAAAVLIALIAAYVFFGGMKTAGVGGILKMLVIWTSLFLAGGLAWYAVHTEADLAAALPAAMWDPFTAGAGQIATNLMSLIVGVICTQSYIQAIFSAANPRTASVGAFAAALVVLPVGLPCALIGMYMQAAQPGIVPVLVLPTYLFQHTSALLGGVAMGGIVISLISSIGGLSLGIGTMLANDILAPRLAIHEGRAMLKLERIVVLGVMGVAAVIAIANEDSQVLFWNYLSMALRGCGVFLPLTFAIFLPRYVAKRWAVISMLLATVVSLGLTLAGAPWNPLFSGLAASLICLVPGLLSPQQEKEVPAAEL